MLKVNHLDHINIFVKNLEKSAKFYQEHFGFKLYREGIGLAAGLPYKIIGISGKIMICMYQQESAPKISGLNHIGIHIQNFDEALEYLKQAQVELLYGGVNEYENSRSLYIADPDGHEFELSENFGGGL